ncbi:hypothetical protein GOP47_0028087 [Adiantum capillus-veneris]|nr:hypothetical protein GOP47_0028087 [Adiantum capillus-veneris]
MDFFQQRFAACSNLSSNGPSMGLPHNTTTPDAGGLLEELWQACAGSLAYVPRVNERVWYFPQGHMEQVTASTKQDGCQQLPNPGLSSQILCRVIDGELSAEADTDEVYAKISLVPEPHESLGTLPAKTKQEEAASQPQPKSSTRRFIKILTASDTSTHGGFSVLRKHAEECLPPLDMTQETPTQELKAKDLRGYEWKFRHTYRGHPRRHLLTTGWSLFVSQKKLLAGDAVIFLRGENGELRVGIRRAKRPPNVPQAVMSGESMHMGVVATALHALGTRTMFSVFFKPRISCCSFLVPVEKFAKAMSVSLSVGMRFKMQFEAEDASDRSFTGTITGIEELNAENWADSKWRSLKVDWDELNLDHPNRVSPWEIELVTSPTVVNPPPTPVRNKRQRPSLSISSSIADVSGAGFNRASLESTFGFEVPNVLQGQEAQDMGMSPLWKTPGHLNFLMQETHHPQQLVHMRQQRSQEVGMSSLPSKRFLFSPSEIELKAPLQPPFAIHGSTVRLPSQSLQIEYGAGWPATTSDASLTRLISSIHSQEESLHIAGKVPLPLPVQAPTSLCHPTFHPQIPSSRAFTLTNEDPCITFPDAVPTPPLPVASESGIKLFGISLTETPTGKGQRRQDLLSSEENLHKGEVPLRRPDAQTAETVKVAADPDQEGVDHSEAESRSAHSTRSCIKVIKKGNMVGRGIHLSRFEDYGSLFEGLEAMFNLKGELTDPEKGWQVAYSDREGDTMKVGDDPWPEFCRMVRKLHIISPEEMQGRC